MNVKFKMPKFGRDLTFGTRLELTEADMKPPCQGTGTCHLDCDDFCHQQIIVERPLLLAVSL